MEYRLKIDDGTLPVTYYTSQYDEVRLLEGSQECDRLDVTDIKTFRIIMEDKEYRLTKQYVFLDKRITLYIIEQ